MIEQATGGTVAEALREEILDPLRLHDVVSNHRRSRAASRPTATEDCRRSRALCGSAVATRRIRQRRQR